MAEPRSDEEGIRREIVQVCRLMYARGLIAATDGNVSARLDGGRLVTTPSGVPKGLLTEADLVTVDTAGRPLSPGARELPNPSAEIRMHLEIYRQRPDVAAVVHAHPPITTALTVAGVSLAPCVLPETLVNVGTIVTTRYATPTSAEVPEVIRDLVRRHDALVLDRHGAVTMGSTPLEAYCRMEKVENTAYVLYIARQLGQVKILPLEEIRRLVEKRREILGAADPRVMPACEACGACDGFAEGANPQAQVP